jgi:hypothetical protein
MHRRPPRSATWPVLLVVALSLAGCAMLSHTEADDLDPAVWQAIVAEAPAALTVVPLKSGETP